MIKPRYHDSNLVNQLKLNQVQLILQKFDLFAVVTDLIKSTYDCCVVFK